MKLDEFLKLGESEKSERPEDYKFEYEFLPKSDTIDRYCTYAACEIKKWDKNDAVHYKNGKKFAEDVKKYAYTDCDGTLAENADSYCLLSRYIYRALWGWDDIDDAGNVKRYGSIDNIDYSLAKFGMMGPDTMNSAQTTVDKVIGKMLEKLPDDNKIKKIKPNNWDPSKKLMLELYKNSVSSRDFLKGSLIILKEFLDFYHTIGNFVLVPKYFNTFRYCKTGDFWDKRLLLLKDKPNEPWKYKYKENEYIVEWDKKLFNAYINNFFLWDYVDVSGNPIVISDFFVDDNGVPIVISNYCKDNYNYNYNIEGLEEFLKKTTAFIKRRGKFMVAMLKIIDLNPEDYKKLVEKVFNTDTVYDGYEGVIKAIKESCYNSFSKEEKGIIDSLSDRLNEYNLKD